MRDHQLRLGKAPSACSRYQALASLTINEPVPLSGKTYIRAINMIGNQWTNAILSCFSTHEIPMLVLRGTRGHTFLAILLYSSTNASRLSISSVSDTKSPLVEVQVALLWAPLEDLLTRSNIRPRLDETEGLGCKSGVGRSLGAPIFAGEEG